MKHAYLIMAHTQPELLKRILNVLDHTDNDFFIHLDKKSPLEPEDFEGCITKGRIYFTDRVSVVWGHFNQIEAEYLLLKKATELCEHDYYHLITGQDFPLRSVEEINEFFLSNSGKEFIHFSKDSLSKKQYVPRLMIKYPFLKHYGRTKNKWYYLSYIMTNPQGIFYRVFKPDWSPQKFLMGSAFFSITDDLARYLTASQKEVFKRYKYSANCDEVFIQTLVYNSKFKDNLYVKEHSDSLAANMRYIDWKNGSNGSPATITAERMPAALSSGMLFTRKVDIVNHPDAVEML